MSYQDPKNNSWITGQLAAGLIIAVIAGVVYGLIKLYHLIFS